MAQLEVGLAMRQVGRVGRERMDCNRKGERRDNKEKERLNLASFKLNVLDKLCYMITLIMQQNESICHAMP
jgi:hypothetical protein